jgi:hypothetical protein
MFSDDILLIIFLHGLNVSPQYWPTLTHVCQKWRQIVFKSPLGLNLRLYCTYGTPALKTLLLATLNYGGSPKLDFPAPEDEENVMAALKQSEIVLAPSASPSQTRSWRTFRQSLSHFRI